MDGSTDPCAFAASNAEDELLRQRSMELRLDVRNRRFARRLSPDFQTQARLVALRVVEMAAAEFAEGFEEIATPFVQRGELLCQTRPVALANPGDQDVL
jgi:hypothetical protein